MATEKDNSDENRFIEDRGAISQSPIQSTSSHSDISLPSTRTLPTVLAVPVISSHTHSSISLSLQSSNSCDRGGITSSDHVQSNVLPQKSVQSSINQFGTISSNKGFPMTSKSETRLPQKQPKISELSSSKIVASLQKNITEPASNKIVPTWYSNSKSVYSNVVPAHQNITEPSCSTTVLASQNITVLGRNNIVPESCQSTSDISQSRLERTLHKLDPLSTTDICSDSEPLNLTVGSKSNEISSSLFGVISKEHDNEKATETGAEKATGSSYKIQHPIGSRKVTEYVITYPKQMFQSVTNTIFENKKNLMMGKRNADEERNKGDSSSAECKKRKVETPISPNKDGKAIVKKKCTIENIIERIRTEKTLSRGGSAQVMKSIEQEKDKTDSLQNEKKKIEISLPKQKKSESNFPKLKKTGSISPNQQRDGNSSSEVKNIDSNSPKQKDDGSSSSEQKNIDSISPNQLGDAGSFLKQKLVESSSQKQTGDGSACPNQNTIDSNYLKQKRNESISHKKSNNSSPKQKKPKNSSQKQTKKSESGSPTGNGNDSITCNKVQCKKVKKKESEGNEYLSVISKEMENNDGADANVSKSYKKKDINDEKTIIKKKKIKTEKVYVKYDDMEIKKSIGEKVKVKRNLQLALNKSIAEPKKIDRRKKSDARTEDKKKTKPGRKESVLEEKSGIQPKITKQTKQKLQLACRRVKREASLNATMFLNILNEKSPRMSKLSAQRSKSDSDINHTPILNLQSSHSMTNVGAFNCGENDKGTKKEVLFSHKDLLTPKKEPKSPKQTKSPKRKVSFSDDMFDAIFDAVIQRSIEANEKCNKQPRKRSGEAMVTVRKTSKEMKSDDKLKKKKADVTKIKDKNKKCVVKLKPEKKDKKFRLQKIKQAIKMTVTKSPEEVAEKKRKANLARLARARELINTERKVSEKNSVEEKDYDDSVSIISEKDESESIDRSEMEANTEEVKKMKAKKGALCRAARTHVSVEAKTVVENAMPSARWCECCQSSYYPCQPTRGTQVWRIKHLVDKDSSKSPEPIQSSSNHFISAHASCEVRPYASPSHVSVIDSTPYVGQIMPHGHIQCSACSCGHSGVFHPGPGQCQNCTLGSVSNMLPCQRYGSTYSVTYPHTHGSYTHCGCGACYPVGSYHHSVGQTLIHPPQISLSTESPILLHHPVQLQVAHEASLPITMSPISHSHSDPSLAHSVQPVSLQLGHSEQNLQNLTHMCQLSQGEVTNVSVMASNSPSDHEIDVGTRDDIAKSVPKPSSSSGLKHVDQVFKSIKNKKGNSSKDSTSKIQRSESSELQVKDISKVKMAEKSYDETDFQLKLKEKKRSNLLLIKQKQKQLEQKSMKIAQKKDLKASSAKPEISMNDKKVEDKIKSTELPIPKKEKVKRSVSTEPKNEDVKEHSKRAWHGWSWEGAGVMKKVTDIFDGQTVQRKCYNAIRHDDGDTIQVKDCVLVCSGQKEKDIPFVAKVSYFWEDSVSGEMMMSVLWFYRPEHAEGGPIFGSLENEVFAAKHRDETLVACIEDRGFVLTYNEYCRFMAEVERTKSDFPLRKKVVPEPEDPYPSNRVPPVDVNPENVFLCRQVYDIKLKRVLKNPS